MCPYFFDIFVSIFDNHACPTYGKVDFTWTLLHVMFSPSPLKYLRWKISRHTHHNTILIIQLCSHIHTTINDVNWLMMPLIPSEMVVLKWCWHLAFVLILNPILWVFLMIFRNIWFTTFVHHSDWLMHIESEHPVNNFLAYLCFKIMSLSID